MRASRFLLALLSTVALTGCDPGGSVSTAAGGQANALTGEEAADTEEAEAFSAEKVAEEPVAFLGAEDGHEEEESPEPLVVEWTDTADALAVAALSFTVTNATPYEMEIAVAIQAKSVLGEAVSKIGDATLAAGETEAFSVEASALPIRSDKVVGSVTVALARTIETPDGVGRTVTTRSLGRAYRHAPGYALVRTYTAASLASELGGVTAASAVSAKAMASKGIASAAAAETLGYLSDGAGGFAAVSAAQSGLIVRAEDGHAIGFIGVMRRGVGSDDAAPVESAEMEVGDE